MGTPALEDGLFANLLIFNDLYVFRYFCKGKVKEGKGKGKGKWTSLEEFGRVWTSLDEFGRVWTSLDEFGRA